jgi:hypothetical protein
MRARAHLQVQALERERYAAARVACSGAAPLLGPSRERPQAGPELPDRAGEQRTLAAAPRGGLELCCLMFLQLMR